jgi:hypothetical protein
MANDQTYCIDCDVFLSDGEPCLYSGPAPESPNKGCRAGRTFATPAQQRNRSMWNSNKKETAKAE